MGPRTSSGRTRVCRFVCCGLLLLVVPRSLAGQETEEQRYAPATVLSCDLAFAVLASPSGEPTTVRRCTEAEAGDLVFAPEPIVELAHVEAVAVRAAGPDLARVVVRLTAEGVRRLRRAAVLGDGDRLAVVLDGEVVARVELHARRGTRRLTVVDGVSRKEAERMAGWLRAARR